MVLKRLAIVLCALVQLAPANMAIAAEDGNFKIVICTPEGQTLISWSELTGEPSPFSGSQEHESDPSCDACVGCCRIGATGFDAGSCFPNARHAYAAYIEPADETFIVVRAAGPPLPSRAPPLVFV